MSRQTQQRSVGNIDIHELMNESSQLHANISQNVVVITEDKLELCLMKHKDTLKAKSDWKTPVAIFVTLVPILITADFKNTLGLPAETWSAIVILSCIITGVWSIKTLIHAYRFKKTGDIETIISDIKKISTEK